MFRILLLPIALWVLAQPAMAEETPPADPQLETIATMPVKELDAVINGIAVAVNKDALRLKGFAQGGDCLDLIHAANSLALAYSYLAQVRDTASTRTDKEAPVLVAKAVQVRVVTFASRVRAEEWLAQSCRGYVVPAAQAGDPRYQVPAKVANADYTDAVIEARQTAETNLAIAARAAKIGRCPEAIAAGQNIALLLPYLEKLSADTADRPEVLGPRASRRGLDLSRRQLSAALDQLQAQFGETCGPAEAAPRPDADPAP